jgi:hypothetical protein
MTSPGINPNLPACSILPQQTTLPRAPYSKTILFIVTSVRNVQTLPKLFRLYSCIAWLCSFLYLWRHLWCPECDVGETWPVGTLSTFSPSWSVAGLKMKETAAWFFWLVTSVTRHRLRCSPAFPCGVNSSGIYSGMVVPRYGFLWVSSAFPCYSCFHHCSTVPWDVRQTWPGSTLPHPPSLTL